MRCLLDYTRSSAYRCWWNIHQRNGLHSSFTHVCEVVSHSLLPESCGEAEHVLSYSQHMGHIEQALIGHWLCFEEVLQECFPLPFTQVPLQCQQVVECHLAFGETCH